MPSILLSPDINSTDPRNVRTQAFLSVKETADMTDFAGQDTAIGSKGFRPDQPNSSTVLGQGNGGTRPGSPRMAGIQAMTLQVFSRSGMGACVASFAPFTEACSLPQQSVLLQRPDIVLCLEL